MIITKYTKQKMELVKKNLPDLYETLSIHFPEMIKMDNDHNPLYRVIAGLIIEYVLKSGGDPEIFQDSDLEKLSPEEEFLLD